MKTDKISNNLHFLCNSNMEINIFNIKYYLRKSQPYMWHKYYLSYCLADIFYSLLFHMVGIILCCWMFCSILRCRYHNKLNLEGKSNVEVQECIEYQWILMHIEYRLFHLGIGYSFKGIIHMFHFDRNNHPGSFCIELFFISYQCCINYNLIRILYSDLRH